MNSTRPKTPSPVAARKATLARRFAPAGVAAMRAAAVGETPTHLMVPVPEYEAIAREHAAYRVITLGARRAGNCCD